MISKYIEIRNSIGLHARPAAMLAAAASKYQACACLRYKSSVTNLKSSVHILALALNCGETVELIVTGSDEEAAFGEIDKVFGRINENEI